MNILEEYNDDQSLDAIHIYNGNMRLATIIPGDDIYYVCTDQIMSNRAMVDESFNIDQQRTYYPYGEEVSSSGTVSAYKYGGKECDATGLYYFGKRYYDPTIGRWLSCDPAEQGWSPYVYCGGNPVNMVDPDGEFFFSLILGPVGAIIDAACWSATFDALIQGANIAMGNQSNFNWAQFGGAFAAGAIGGSFAYCAPSFSSMSTFGRYAAKAGYAAGTAAGTSIVGMGVNDLLDKNNSYNIGEYLQSAGTAALFAGGISIASSAYDYMSWDRYSNDQKASILTRKSGISTTYNSEVTGLKPSWGSDGNMSIEAGPDVLSESKGFALSGIDHERIHDINRINHIQGNTEWDLNLKLQEKVAYHDWNERTAHMHQLMNSFKYGLSKYEWKLISEPYKVANYGVPSYKGFGVYTLFFTTF